MERYDYRDAVREDVLTYIRENVTLSDYANASECYDFIYDDMFVSDSITGNGSGSYTFNSWRAEEYICHNFDLLAEACNEFGSLSVETLQSAESCDVTIRCYLLSEVLSEVLDEFEDNGEFDTEDEDENEDEE